MGPGHLSLVPGGAVADTVGEPAWNIFLKTRQVVCSPDLGPSLRQAVAGNSAGLWEHQPDHP